MTIKRIIFALLAAFICLLVHGRTYVVCIGISDYPGYRNDLTYSDHDARAMNALFKKGGANTVLLTNGNATVEHVMRAMHIFREAEADDAILFYFSGHGLPGLFCCYDGSLHYNIIYEAMHRSKASKKMIIADACHSGQIRRNSERAADSTQTSVMFFLSSRSNERSIEPMNYGRNAYEWRNSLFTTFVLQALRGRADMDADGFVSAIELYEYVHSNVAAVSRGLQHPVMWGKFDRDMPISMVSASQHRAP